MAVEAVAVAPIVATQCTICLENFNNAARKRITCENCQTEICMKCVKRFLADTVQEPNCMNCRELYTNEFMDANVGYRYRKTLLKNVRLEVLVSREKEFMPDLMHRAQALKEMKRLDKEISKQRSIKHGLQKEMYDLHRSKQKIEDTIRASTEKVELVNTELGVEFMQKSHQVLTSYYKLEKELQDKIDLQASQCQELNEARNKFHNVYYSKGAIKANATMHCIRDDCKGFLNDEYVCGLCNLKICKDCHEELVEVEGEGEAHKCKPENVESVKAIENETKPCPTCRTRVYKTEGCDQMFCVQCHTAFSWNTGMIDRGRIHNPHYFEWLRRNRQQMPREIGDVPCGGLPSWLEIKNNLKTLQCDVFKLTYLSSAYKMTVFLQNKEVPKYPVREGRDETLNTIAIDYMADVLTEKQWKTKLFNLERKKEINMERRLILDMMLAVMIDNFRDLAAITTSEDLANKVEEVRQIRKYFNKSIKNLGRRFECYNFKCIDKTWMTWEY